jgi:hypothetical protein
MLRVACAIALFAVSPVADARMPVFREIQIGGVWDSTYGEVKLTQTGNRVHGEYKCCGGGTLDGYIRRSEVRFHWKEPRGAGEGEGVWRLQRDGSLQGSWGLSQSDSNGSTWNLWRPKQTKQIAQ